MGRIGGVREADDLDRTAQVRLLFGTSDQVELELPLSVIPPIVTTLQNAERAAQ